jgi:hypothetical protein
MWYNMPSVPLQTTNVRENCNRQSGMYNADKFSTLSNRHRTKTNQAKNTTQKTKKLSDRYWSLMIAKSEPFLL